MTARERELRMELGNRLLAKADRWPQSWAGHAEEQPLGEKIVGALRPFLVALASSSLAETTLRRHFANAWMLGGEIVRAASHDSTVFRLEGRELLLRFVDDEGGPVLGPRCSEAEQRSFDGTCRKLLDYLT